MVSAMALAAHRERLIMGNARCTNERRPPQSGLRLEGSQMVSADRVARIRDWPRSRHPLVCGRLLARRRNRPAARSRNKWCYPLHSGSRDLRLASAAFRGSNPGNNRGHFALPLVQACAQVLLDSSAWVTWAVEAPPKCFGHFC